MNYEERITVFVDILGFKDILNETIDKDGNDNTVSIDKLLLAYSTIREIWDLDEENLLKMSMTSKQITTFSDCIVISFLAKESSEIFFTIQEVKWMVMRLLNLGILCRGAISYGKLIHTENVLFGPALVEAYILESKAANYPRIILDRTIIDLAGKAKSEDHTSLEGIAYVEDLLEKDLDGMYYIDYFGKAMEELDDPAYDFTDYIGKLADKIRAGMNASKHPSKADVRVKYIWMKEKYNKMIEETKNKDFLNALRVRGDDELYNFYNKLSKINPSASNVFVKKKKYNLK